MTTIRAALIALTLAITSYAGASADTTGKSEFAGTLKQLVDSNKLIGTHFVAVVDPNGLVSFVKYSAEQQHFDENSHFLIASHTKAFTGTLAAILDHQNTIYLQQSVNHYAPSLLTNSKLDSDAITLQRLLTHTGGFTSIQHSFKTAYLGYESQDELTDSLNRNTLVAPDYSFRYSNTGPIVAATAMEQAAGKPWQTLLDDYIFSPLGMHNTAAQVTDKLLPSIITANDGSVFRRGHFKTDATMHASGGVISTVADLATWLQTNIKQDGKALGADDLFTGLHTRAVKQDKAYFTYQRTGYTLGWDIAQYNGETLLTRFGTYAGYSLHVSFMPERQLGVIAFTNQDIGFVLPHVIANFAYNTLLNKDNASTLLDEESSRLSQSVEKQLQRAPNLQNRVTADELSGELLGEYTNTDGWPVLSVTNETGNIKVRWGALTGVLLKQDEGYLAHFGALARPLRWTEAVDGPVTLRNGSIVYQQR